MKKEIVAILFLATILLAWESTRIPMSFTGSEEMDFFWTRCNYRQSAQGEFQTSIVISTNAGACPEAIGYYPESDSWE
jgi:hypothetical protein